MALAVEAALGAGCSWLYSSSLYLADNVICYQGTHEQKRIILLCREKSQRSKNKMAFGSRITV